MRGAGRNLPQVYNGYRSLVLTSEDEFLTVIKKMGEYARFPEEIRETGKHLIKEDMGKDRKVNGSLWK